MDAGDRVDGESALGYCAGHRLPMPRNAAPDVIRRTRPSWRCPAPQGTTSPRRHRPACGRARDDFTARIPAGQRTNVPEMDLCLWRVPPMDLGRQLSSRVVAMTGDLRAHLFAEAAAMIAAEMPQACELAEAQALDPTRAEERALLQIVPSKTDTDRLLVVWPELAHVLARAIAQVRGTISTSCWWPATTTLSGSPGRRCRTCSAGSSPPRPSPAACPSVSERNCSGTATVPETAFAW